MVIFLAFRAKWFGGDWKVQDGVGGFGERGSFFLCVEWANSRSRGSTPMWTVGEVVGHLKGHFFPWFEPPLT